MAEDSFVGREVTVRFTMEEVVSYTGTVLRDDERGVLLRRPYRKGVRLELVPRDSIRSVYHTEEKGHKKAAAASTPEPVEPEVDDDDDEFDDDDEGFEEAPDLEFDDE